MERKPEWFRKVLRPKDLIEMRTFLRQYNLNTVCEEAACPNRGECFQKKTVTFMILGKACTRSCRFCDIETKIPKGIDEAEPYRVAEAITKLNLSYVVITSVTRDDLDDGGAGHFFKTITEVKKKSPDTTVEVLIPDFICSVDKVVHANPDVIGHNIETVPRLYKDVRPQANYHKSLGLLAKIKLLTPRIYTKSGIMVGLGETYKEVLDVMRDLRDVGCDVITVGQYARPSKKQLKVSNWVHPDTFEQYKKEGEMIGFLHVESAPYVRSSFRAADFLKKIKLCHPEISKGILA